MKQSDTKEFRQKLYGAINQAANDAVIPSFDALAARIAKDEPIESFERFFESGASVSSHAKSRRFRVRAFGTAAAAILLVLSGVWAVSAMNARSFDTASSEAVYCEESAAQVTFSLEEEKNSGEADMAVAESTMKAAENTADWYSPDCAEAIIAGGRKLLVPLDELTGSPD